VKAWNQLSSSSTSSKTPYFANPFEYKVELPYLAEKVSEAERQIQAAERKFLSQLTAEQKVTEAQQAAETAATAAAKFEEAQAVAAEKLALETAAMQEKSAWDKVVLEKVAAEKAEEEAALVEQVVAVQAQAEQKMDVAIAAKARAEMARTAAAELEAERASAFLAEESATAEEKIAGQEMVTAMQDVQETAADFGAKAADLKSITEKATTAAATATAPMVNRIQETAADFGAKAADLKSITEKATAAAATATAPMVNRIISGKVNMPSTPTALSNLFNGPGLNQLFETNRSGATASLVTAAVAAVGTILRFRGEKKKGLYDDQVVVESSVPQTSSGTATAGSSKGASAKGSYSPFGRNNQKASKMKSSASSSLYAPPTRPSSAESATIPPPKASNPAVAKTIVEAAPVAEKTAYGSYLENISGSSSGSVKPSLYSPFGSMKMASSSLSDSLYSPPVVAAVSPAAAAAVSESIPPPPVVETTPQPVAVTSSYGSYLDKLSGANSVSSMPSSYSPFGDAFMTASSSSSDSLYGPPESSTGAAGVAAPGLEAFTTNEDVSPAVVAVAPEAPPAAYGSYLEILSGSASGSVKASSYSPFGSSPAAVGSTSSSNDSLYSPPASFSYDNVDEPMMATTTTAVPHNANGSSNDGVQSSAAPQDELENGSSYLEALSGAAPTSSRGSYSPFGTIKLTAAAAATSSTLYDPPASANGSSRSSSGSSSSASHQTNAAVVVVVEDRIRTAYNEWCQYYGKANAMERMDIFAQNFRKAEEFYQSSGTALMLNEYADLTFEEYEELAAFQ
jgi:hypothetical protein